MLYIMSLVLIMEAYTFFPILNVIRSEWFCLRKGHPHLSRDLSEMRSDSG